VDKNPGACGHFSAVHAACSAWWKSGQPRSASLEAGASVRPEELDELWERVLSRLAEKIPDSQLDAYLRSASLSEDGEGARLDLFLPDKFTKDAVEKHRLDGKIREALEAEGQSRPVRLRVRRGRSSSKRDPDQVTLPFDRPPPPSAPPPTQAPPNLNPKYTLDSFVVGDGNKLACAICEAAISSPGEAYNPIFLYGGVGLGKTHLMQAVGHGLLQNDPNTRVRYVSSEAFSNEYIRAVVEKRTAQFRERHRGLDLLLIDDVQFFGGKEGLQEEFFHTFNELYQAGKQIILTSDRSPKQLEMLQERLISRFESGVVSDVKPPNVETRIAILYRLAERAGLEAAPGTLEVLAERIRENIRLLEGAFYKVQALCSLQKTGIRPEIVEAPAPRPPARSTCR
jgi:chromosomal replication initiator protein